MKTNRWVCETQGGALTRVEPVFSIFYTVIDVLDQLVLKRDGALAGFPPISMIVSWVI